MFRSICAGAACAAIIAAAASAAPPPHAISPALGHVGQVPDAGGKVHRAVAAVPCVSGSEVTMSNGAVICGVLGSYTTNYLYLGIPYAKQERWKNSAVLPPASKQATVPGKICPQAPVDAETMGEDCLNLNIWMPKDAARQKAELPVLVFIHGGAFLTGAGSSPLYDGSKLATRGPGIIVVTINYRLGALGFLTSTKQDTAKAGNFGLLDQQNALKWIQANIASFGGAPGHVTIVGESAGAMSVGLHTFSVPTSAGLFWRAIMESNPMGEHYQHDNGAHYIGNHFIDFLCSNPSGSGTNTGATCTGDWASNASKMPWANIVAAQNNFLTADVVKWGVAEKALGIRSLPWQPHIAKDVVADQPYFGASSGAAKIPVAFGVNKDEGVIFAELLAGETRGANTGNPITDYPAVGDFDNLVEYGFPSGDKTVITNHYADPEPAATTYYSGYGTAFSNLVNDFMFKCGNEYVANGLAQSGWPVYFYDFTQPPFFDMYNPAAIPAPTGGNPDARPDNGACDPSAGNVCHGNELPYVFYNFESIKEKSGGKYQPGDSDFNLGTQMHMAWAAFAYTPAGQTLPAPWLAYSASTNLAFELNGTAQAGSTVDIDTASQCLGFWQNGSGQGVPHTPFIK
jgi:para-nitrobenzyl esterase